MPEYKIISKETLVPLGVMLAALAFIVPIVVWSSNLSNQVQANKEKIVAHEAMDDARVQALQLQMQSTQTQQTKTDAKLDYIVTTLDEIKKGIK